jgi:cytochrome c oxidase assembly factor CtaG
VLTHGDARLPELTPARVLDTWVIDPVLATALVLAALLYLAAVRQLRRRGIPWSRARTTLWMCGLAIIFVGTSSSVGAYDTTLFTMHAVQHMLLQMLAPIPLALAAPITLALRALPRTQRGVLLRVLHSAPSRVITHPLSAYAVFTVSPFALYYSPLYEATLRSDVLHDLGHLHLILTGFLLFSVLLALDPLPHRLPYVLRLMMIIGLGPMHVLLGIPVMMGNTLFAEDYYLELGREWGPSLLSDQQTGGGLMWVFGDVVTIAFLGGIFLQWLRSDAREARRTDRHLDRLYGVDATSIPVPWQTSPTAIAHESGSDAERSSAERPSPAREH